jgi:hypothetical protein
MRTFIKQKMLTFLSLFLKDVNDDNDSSKETLERETLNTLLSSNNTILLNENNNLYVKLRNINRRADINDAIAHIFLNDNTKLISAVDNASNFIYINQHMTDLFFNIPKDEIIGKKLNEIITSSYILKNSFFDAMHTYDLELLESNNTYIVKIEHGFINGTAYVFRINKYFLKRDNFVGILTIMEDITSEYYLHKSLISKKSKSKYCDSVISILDKRIN